MSSRLSWILAALAAGAALTACQDAFFHEPAVGEPVAIGLSYSLASSVAAQTTPVEDFENADEARIRVSRESRTLVDRVVPVSPADNGIDKVARIEVPIGEEAVSVSVEATLLVDGRAALQGFITFRVDPGAEVTPQADIVMLPVLTEGQTRVVLSWGEQPRDLDSHMTGPDGQGGQFHVYFAAQGNSTNPPFVTLDTDDTSSYGPETITIWNQAQGNYCYSVNNFSGSPALTTSEARVEVYQGDTRVNTFEVPAEGSGRVWTVFQLNTDGITPINRIDADQQAPGVC